MPAQAREGECLAGWRLLRTLGRGAQSTVFLAEPAAGGAAVALKLVDLAGAGEQARQAFLAGSDRARRLVHLHIVAVLGAGVQGDLGWLAMEAVPGTSLCRYTHGARLLPEPLALRAAEAVAGALAHAHRHGVVHRDVKPANVLVHWPSDTLKLADFGLSRATGADQTATGVVPGSPGFMAPEQLAGALPTPASDFYGLGVMLFQLLTGRLPHEADTLGELLRRVASQPAPDVRTLRPDLPPPVANLVAGLLARNPDQRPTGGEALWQAMRLAHSATGGVKSR